LPPYRSLSDFVLLRLCELQVGHRVPEDLLVHGHQDQTLQLGLGDEQPVEWIAVQLWKRSGPLRLLDCDGQGLESVLENGLSQCLVEDQLSQAPLDGDLPYRHGADKDLILRPRNCGAKSGRQEVVV